MLLHYLALIAVSIVHQVNGMQRLPAPAIRGIGSASDKLFGRAASVDTLALQNQESFYMGDASNPSNPLVQLTGMANSSDTQLLSTEQFADMIAHMSCAPDQVQMQFAAEDNFKAAQTAWGWVNQNPSNLIILVTGDKGCLTAPQSGLPTSAMDLDESYGIRQITFNPSDLTATFVGNAAPFGQLLDGYWSLKGNSAGLTPQNVQRRHDWTGNVDLSHQVTIPDVFNDKVAGPVNASLDAVLSTQGTLNWDLSIDALHLDKASLTLDTTNVAFTLTSQLSLSGSIQALPVASFDLPAIPIGSPEGPFDSKIGLYLYVGGQANLGDVSAAITASVDLVLSLSDGSIDLSASSPSVNGFSPSFNVDNPEISGQVDLTSSIGPTISLVMQASIGGYGLEGGVSANAPEMDMTLSAEASTAGVCGGDESVGVDIDIGIGAALDVVYLFGHLEDGATSSLNVFSTSTPLYSTCTGFGPTIDTSSTTSSPTTTSTVVPATTPAITTVPLGTGATTTVPLTTVPNPIGTGVTSTITSIPSYNNLTRRYPVQAKPIFYN